MAIPFQSLAGQKHLSSLSNPSKKTSRPRTRMLHNDLALCSHHQTYFHDSTALSAQQTALCRRNINATASTVLLETSNSSPETIETITAAWQSVGRSIPVLRTRIEASGDGSFIQIVQSHANHVNHASTRQLARDGAFLQLMRQGSRTIVVLYIHQALVDKTSLALLQKSFFLCFNGYAAESRQGAQAYHKYVAAKDPQPATSYWKKLFSQCGKPSPLHSFPQKHEAPRLETVVVARGTHLDSLVRFADEFDIRPHDVLYAAWALVADRHTHSGHRNACFVVEGRDISFLKHESVIGLVDQKFPLMLPLSEDTTVLAWISRVRNMSAEASCNAFVGYQNILEAVEYTQPQVKLVVRLSDDDQDVMSSDDEDFALVLNASVTTQLKLSLRHNASVTTCDAQILLEHVLEALQNMLENPFSKISEVEITSQDEVDFILQVGKAAFKPQQGLLHSLVEQQAKLTPDSSAVEFESSLPLSYSTLNTKANQLARQMLPYRGSVIPVCMRTTPELILVLLAILKAGAAYVILDPDAPAERNRLILDMTGAIQVVVDSATTGLFNSEIQVDNLLELSQQNEELNLALDQDSNDTAYIIFTSGSTGRPKAAVLDHNAAYNGLAAFPKAEGRRQLLFFNPVFSAAQRSIWAPLCTGGCLCLASKENLTVHTARTIASMKINSIEMTSTTASLISPEITPSLQRLALGGEMPSPSLVQLWGQKVELLSSYGLSECTQLNARRRLESASQARFLGRAFDTTTAYILTPESSALSPLLIPGELCFGGAQLAKEYLNNPEETKKRFIENPFGYGRLYRTGDLAVRHADGSIELLGRIDFQVKINGQKVDPEESNTIIQGHCGVKHSAVVSATVGKKTVLVAMIVIYDGGNWDATVDELRSAVGDKLPLYMVPSFWIPTPSLPLNLNQKVDTAAIRRNVEALAAQGLLLTPGSRNPSINDVLNDHERIVRKVWSDFVLVQESEISREDSFLALGGTSLEAVQVASKLHSDHALTLRVEDIIMKDSLAQVAACVQNVSQKNMQEAIDIAPYALMQNGFQVEELGLTSCDVDDVYPVTPFQEGVITNAVMGGVDFIYRRAYNFEGHSVDLVKEALQTLMSSQPLLRTVFTSHARTYLQVVRSTVAVPWETVDSDLKALLQKEPEPMILGDL